VKLVVDSREQRGLVFPATRGVEVITQALPLGDYSAIHESSLDSSFVERKSVGDLFSSFVGDHYLREKAKWTKAQDLHLHYILAVEATFSNVLKGYSYSRKGGLAQVRQLMTISRKYGIEVWYCAGRQDMAWRILEYFLAQERVTP